MFICTECKTQHNNKPDYCNCGNDLFEEIQNKAFKTFSDLITKTFGPVNSVSLSIFWVCVCIAILIWLF
jgi:hypothetical protein